MKRNQTRGTAGGAGVESSEEVTVPATGIGARIGRAADAIGTRESAARAMGVSPAALQRYVREANNPPFDALARLCLRSGFRMEWLATGEGPERVAHSGSGTRFDIVEGFESSRWRVAETLPGRKLAVDAAREAIARMTGNPPSPDRFEMAQALVDEAIGSFDQVASGPLAYLIEAVYDLLGAGATASPSQLLRVIRNAIALRP